MSHTNPTPTPEPDQQIIRDIPLIQRYSRHNEAEDFRFRDYLKTELAMSNAQLDAIVKETTERVWSRIDCLTCAHCCKTLQIVVDRTDIARLSARLQLTPSTFMRRYVKVAGDGVMCLKEMPCPFLGDDNRCSVYNDRPQACREFPFLHSNLFRKRTLAMVENSAVCPIVFNVWQRLKTRLWKGKQPAALARQRHK